MSARHTQKGAENRQRGVGSLPETLFVRGKGIDQEIDHHVLPTVPSHLPDKHKKTMCVRRGQRE